MVPSFRGNRRIVILATILLGSLLATRVHRLADWSPFAGQRTAIAQAERRLARLDEEAGRVEAAQAQIEAALRQSLPSDPSRAATLYHAWLIDLLDRTGHEDVVLTPGRIGVERAAFARIPFTLESSATPENLRAFLDVFDASRMLHKIQALRIRRSDENPGLLRATLEIEALSLRDAPVSGGLAQLPSGEPAEDLASRSLAAAFRNDLFQLEPMKEEVVESVMDEQPPEVPDHAAQTHLIATLTRSGTPEAWLYDRRLRRQHVVTDGNEIPTLGPDSRLVAIHRDRIEFLRGEKRCRLVLGQPLSQATEIFPETD